MRAPTIGSATAALGLALVLLASVPARADDTVSVRALAGQAYDGWIVDAADTHAFVLEDFSPQLWSLSVRAARGSTFVPDFALEDPTTADVTAACAPYRSQTARSVVVTRAPFPSGTGRYVLRVRSRNGSVGAYRLRITARVKTTFRGVGAVVASPADVSFFVPTEARASLRVTPISPGSLAPSFLGVTPPDCLAVAIEPGPKTGQASFTAPVSGDYSVTIGGAGATAGAFAWVARVKPMRASRFPVRVNVGAASYPGPGPAPAVFVARTGQNLVGWATDGAYFCWREVRTTGNPKNGKKNSVYSITARGTDQHTLANNFVTDEAPPPLGFGLGPTHAAVVAADQLYAVPRTGGQDTVLEAFVGTVLRVLVDDDAVYVLREDTLRAYPLSGGGYDALPVAAGTLRAVCFGGRGLVYAVETAGPILELRTITRTGTDDSPLATFDPAVTVTALAARGADVFIATDDGAGTHQILRVPACGGGLPVPLHNGGVVSALAVDECNVYGVEDDPVEGPWVRQFPRGGGVPQVLVRGSGTSSFVIDRAEIGARAGLVLFMADVSGSETFFRVKRR